MLLVDEPNFLVALVVKKKKREYLEVRRSLLIETSDDAYKPITEWLERGPYRVVYDEVPYQDPSLMFTAVYSLYERMK